MKRIKEFIVSLLWMIDDAIYELNKRFRKGDIECLQNSLDMEHSLRDTYNEIHGTEYTTKQAVELLGNNL